MTLGESRAPRRGEARVDFVCQRSGRCCRVPDGVAFVDPEELEALAGELGLGADAFAERFVRSKVDPRTGEPRLALRDRPDGACSLLDGDNTCSAYRARPRACVDFPFWRDVLTDAAAFERATTTCPGLVVWPDGAARGAALAQLAALMASAPRPGACPFTGESDGPEVTGLELERLADAVGQGLGELEARPGDAHACSLERDGACSAPGAAPLACRIGCGGVADAADVDVQRPIAVGQEPPIGMNARKLGDASGARESGERRDSGGSGAVGGLGAIDEEQHTLEALANARDALETAAPWPRRRGPLRAAWNRRFDPSSQPLRPPSGEMG